MPLARRSVPGIMDATMPQLSASTLKLFQECPRCFWLHINEKIERPRGPFPSLPSGIDRVLKHYFDRYRQQGILPPLIEGKLDGKLASHALTLGFNDARAKARLWGKLDDCIVLPDQHLAPLDHKTRASAPDDVSYTEKYYQFQMDVYTLLLERNRHPTSRTACVVYYFPVDGMLHQGFPFEVKVHKITTDPGSAYEVFLAACRCLTGTLPASGAACEFCRWAEARPANPPTIPEDLFA
ncbi:MAG: PD-(D/E)XK nuclease family protein [Candidatus Omnitrophica bacterium]|nr:PD-(D/E)XK nuclease family protein [Candidatus Omnitrophota bacterium]